MKKFLYIALAFLTLSLSACKKPIYLTEQDSDRDLYFASGQTIVLTLPINQNTEYEWNFRIEPNNQNTISQVREKLIKIPFAKEENKNVKEFSFHTKNNGRAIITGFYRRPWEQSTYRKRVYYIINVQ